MKKKLLFANTYFYRMDRKQWNSHKPYPPYGTILAASIMRQAGYDVSLFDVSLVESAKKITDTLVETSPDYLIIVDDSFNYLSKMCLTVMREACFEMIQLGKAVGVKVIINSADATDHYEKYLRAGADIVLLGEAEETLQAILQDDLDMPEKHAGIALLKESKLLKTPKTNTHPTLDSYPTPAWDLVKLNEYRQIWEKAHGYFSLNIATTRGCPFKCNWCAKPIYGNKYNSRSPQNVVDEISLLMANGAKHFWICDDIFGLKPGWVKEFNQLLAQKQLKPKLKIQSRADLLLKENTIQDLVDAGLDEVWLGAESGSQKILDAMDKGLLIADIERSTKLLKEKNVKVAFFLQYGYLGEQWGDIQQTLHLVNRLLPDEIGISVSYPLPGTVFYEKVKAEFQQKQNWEDSDDLEMMYKGTYSAKFYRILYQYTHRVYRKEVLRKNWRTNPVQSMLKIPYLWIREQIYSQRLKALLNDQ